MINSIKGKTPEYGIEILQSDEKNPEDQKTMLFSCLVKLTTGEVTGHATETTKKQAQQRACQMFLKALFPKGMTWNGLI